MVGYGLGADDYVRKPFGAAELRAKVAAHLRREGRERTHVLSFGDVRIDLGSKEVSVGGSPVALTPTEYGVCELLARRRGQVLSRAQIRESALGWESEADDDAISMHVSRARRKLSAAGPTPSRRFGGWGTNGSSDPPREGRPALSAHRQVLRLRLRPDLRGVGGLLRGALRLHERGRGVPGQLGRGARRRDGEGAAGGQARPAVDPDRLPLRAVRGGRRASGRRHGRGDAGARPRAGRRRGGRGRDRGDRERGGDLRVVRALRRDFLRPRERLHAPVRVPVS